MPAKETLVSATLALAILAGCKLLGATRSAHWHSSQPNARVPVRQRGFPAAWSSRPGFPPIFGLVFWTALIAAVAFFLGGIGPYASLVRATTLNSTSTPTEDTYLDSATPNANYGKNLKLKVDASPSVQRVLLRFHLTGIPPDASVTSAILRMYVVNRSNEAGVVHKVDGGWSEQTTTWSNAPYLGNKIADISEPALAGTWREADVTSAVAGNGDIDFYVVTKIG